MKAAAFKSINNLLRSRNDDAYCMSRALAVYYIYYPEEQGENILFVVLTSSTSILLHRLTKAWFKTDLPSPPLEVHTVTFSSRW